jgi:hypothetical protein
MGGWGGSGRGGGGRSQSPARDFSSKFPYIQSKRWMLFSPSQRARTEKKPFLKGFLVGNFAGNLDSLARKQEFLSIKTLILLHNDGF